MITSLHFWNMEVKQPWGAKEPELEPKEKSITVFHLSAGFRIIDTGIKVIKDID